MEADWGSRHAAAALKIPMAISHSREFLLLAACAAWPSSNSRSEAIRKLAIGDISYGRFLQLMTRHRLAGLVQHAMTQAQPVLPPHVSTEIHRQALTIVRKSLLMADEARHLQQLFDHAGIPLVFMKGGTLALICYGNLGIRDSRDIDLLVPPGFAQPAIDLLERSGYRRHTPPLSFEATQLRMWLRRTKEIQYVNEKSKLKIEFHIRPFDNPRLLPELASGSQRMILLGSGVAVPTFGEEDLFVYLCVHGALHSWFRMIWLADVSALLAPLPEDAINRLYRAAETKGAGRAAAQALLLCQRLFGLALPQDLTRIISADHTVRRLVAIAEDAMAADRVPLARWFGTTRNTLARILINRDWRYRAAELSLYATSPVDILTLPLPAGLRFLYPILRAPLWLWRRGISRRMKS